MGQAANAFWLLEAQKLVGLKEVPGPGFNAAIQKMWLDLPGGKGFWDTYGKDDSKLPWCGAANAGVFKRCGFPIPKNYASARAWASWGTGLSRPTVGAVVVLARGGNGHVCILAGIDPMNRWMCYGGNQSDGYNLAPFDMNTRELLGLRWPPGAPMPVDYWLPTIASNGKSSMNEA